MMLLYICENAKHLASLTLHDWALLVAQHYVELEKQLGNTLQERLQQSEHAQISSQAKEPVVLIFTFFLWTGIGFSPEHFESSLYQEIIPIDTSNTMTTKVKQAVASVQLIGCSSFFEAVFL